MADLLMINGHPQQSCPILGVRQICAGFGSRLQGEVDYCTIYDTEEKITPKGLTNSSAKLFPPGTLLMAMYGQGITRGKVAILGIEASTNQACVAFFPKTGMKTRYLYYYLEYKYDEIRRLGHGANQKNLSADILKMMYVACPLDAVEQDAMCAALEALDEKLAIHTRRHDALGDLFRSLLHELMTAQIRVHDVDLGNIKELEAA